ncbi:MULTISPECIES: sensor histidine kinase [Luteimonas]|uniref:sensor histidine kinase n=1 Tax=Luteimonas TaxID=83614 RepID=UPI000464E0F6|nr:MULTISPECIES: ATP-binding protein [Luteimonas]
MSVASRPSEAAPEALAERLARAEAEIAGLRRREELLAHGLSHDLRAPLRAIHGYAQAIGSQHGAALDAQARDYLGRIRDAAGRMEGLIEKLLQLSHAARAPLRTDVVDFSMLADWTLAELQDLEPSVAVDVEVQPGLLVQGDERLLKQLLERLIHNAWKFSRQRDRVRIRVQGEPRGDRLLVDVSDAGCGFDPRYAQRLFEPFQRLHGPDQGGGDGLGLAIAALIVERHGGRLWAESEPGRGSVFHLELPAAQLDTLPGAANH